MTDAILARPAGQVADWRQGVLASLVMGLPLIAFMALPAAMPVLMRHFQGQAYAGILVPMLATAPSACIALLAPIAGLIADRVGRRRMALTCLAAYTAMGAAPLLTDTFTSLIACRVLLGVANAGLMTIGSVLLADYFTGEARLKWVGLSSVFGSAAITIALFSGGVLSSWSWRGPLLVPMVGLPILLLGFRYLFEAENNVSAQAAGVSDLHFSWPALGSLAGLTLISAIWFYIEAIQIGLVLDQIRVGPQSLIALVSAVISIGFPAGSMIYSRISGRYTERTILVSGGLLTGLGLVGIGLVRAPQIIIVFGLLQQIGGGLMITLAMHQCQERFAYRHRASAMGVWSSAFFTGQFASPLVMGMATSVAGGLRPGIVLMGFVALLASALLATFFTFTKATMRPGNAVL